jgi:hypothetical protein
LRKNFIAKRHPQKTTTPPPNKNKTTTTKKNKKNKTRSIIKKEYNWQKVNRLICIIMLVLSSHGKSYRSVSTVCITLTK